MIMSCKSKKVDAYGNPIEPGNRIPIYDDNTYNVTEIKKIEKGMGGQMLPRIISELTNNEDMRPWAPNKRGPKNKRRRAFKQGAGIMQQMVKKEIPDNGLGGLGSIEDVEEIINAISKMRGY